jgi:hypothetical protein
MQKIKSFISFYVGLQNYWPLPYGWPRHPFVGLYVVSVVTVLYVHLAGCYFGNYFIMGGERFDTNQQDTYLFGENEDLNFLGSKPVPVSVNFIHTSCICVCDCFLKVCVYQVRLSVFMLYDIAYLIH